MTIDPTAAGAVADEAAPAPARQSLSTDAARNLARILDAARDEGSLDDDVLV